MNARMIDDPTVCFSYPQARPRPFSDGPTERIAKPVAPATARNKNRNRYLSIGVGLVVATGLIVGGSWLVATVSDATGAATGGPASAAVGDCLARSGDEDVTVVGCGDQQAAFRIVGRVEDRTRIQAGLTACSPFEGTTDVYWQGPDGVAEKGLALCLVAAR